MGDSSTASQASVFPNFKSYGLNEVPWWILCCRVYARSFSWRQVPTQVRLAEVEKAQGERPRAPLYPPEPVFLGDPMKAAERQKFDQEHRAWNDQVQTLNADYQEALTAWESRGLKLAQRWDLSPTPELAPFDSRPPEEREWIPVRVFENRVMRSQKAQRVPTTTRSWRQDDQGRWRETLTQGEAWKPYTTEELTKVLQGEACVHLPETLILAVPGRSFLSFLNQLDREVLALVRCRWDRKAGKLVQVGQVPQTFVQPAVEIVASVALSEMGKLPIITWPGVPTDLHKHLKECGWGSTQQVPETREQFAALERWISVQSKLPSWYMAPEYRAVAAVNLCCKEASETWESDYLWRPLLDEESEEAPEAPAEDWQPTL
jgi:hypothetical protein